MRHCFFAASAFGALFIGQDPATAQEPQVIRISMKAAADGGLAELAMGGATIKAPKDGKRTRLDILRTRVRGLVEDSAGRRKHKYVVAEIQADNALEYKHIIAVISAITGYKDASSGMLVKMIDTIKFVPPRREG